MVEQDGDDGKRAQAIEAGQVRQSRALSPPSLGGCRSVHPS